MRKFIQWEDIEVRGNRTGFKKTICPSCSPDRTKKKDPCLYVNFESGVAKCFHCDALGFREERKQSFKEYTLPPQTWQNYTNLSDKIVKWCREERNIRQETLIHFGISEEKAYQPQTGKEMNNLVFNYFEGSDLVNKKFRSGQKNFTQVKGGKPILYNINSVIGEEEVYIVEGEFDVLALYEAGIKPVVSLPNGANDNDDYWINSERYLKDVKRFVIGTDNDEKGVLIREKIAQRLGRYRCTFIEWEGKDANDDLTKGVLTKTVKKVKRFPVGGTFTVEDLYDDILQLYDKGLSNTCEPQGKWLHGINEIWKPMMGQLNTVTGIPSHGKSTFAEWYVVNLIQDHNFKASFFSPEHSPMALHQSTFIQKVVGKPFWGKENRITKSDIERYKLWANERLYLTGAENGEFPTWEWLFEKFKEQLFSYGVNIFVIDAFNKLEFSEKGEERILIRKVLSRLTMFAQMHNVMIFLIAHPTKMKKEDGCPTLYDVSGSADFRNQTHSGYALHRTFNEEEDYTEFVNLKTKFSFQGEIGKTVRLNYEKKTGRYYCATSQPCGIDFTEGYKPKEIDIFDTWHTEDCPF
jgi:twinkle protein